jgi:transglutaminase-like putative cysteine protease
LYDSPRIRRSTIFREFAEPSFDAEDSAVDAISNLAQRIHDHFKYDPLATHCHTQTEEAFELRRGVCQDFAHIMIAALRSMGVPARYISGYLRTIPPPGKERLIGADQSHAWVAAYCGSETGWIEFDPTNSCLCGSDHIPIAWGRDYSDIVPVRGTFLGGGDSRMHVSVDVIPLEK